jgi:hypothetical protein
MPGFMIPYARIYDVARTSPHDLRLATPLSGATIHLDEVVAASREDWSASFDEGDASANAG